MKYIARGQIHTHSTAVQCLPRCLSNACDRAACAWTSVHRLLLPWVVRIHPYMEDITNAVPLIPIYYLPERSRGGELGHFRRRLYYQRLISRSGGHSCFALSKVQFMQIYFSLFACMHYSRLASFTSIRTSSIQSGYPLALFVPRPESKKRSHSY